MMANFIEWYGDVFLVVVNESVQKTWTGFMKFKTKMSKAGWQTTAIENINEKFNEGI